MDARMKMMRDARPRTVISLLTTCCPTKAAIVATATRYRATHKKKSKTDKLPIPWSKKTALASRMTRELTIWNRESFKKVVFYNRH